MIEAIIFDLDGVLVHTDKYHYLAWKSLADRLGIYFDESINNRCRGVSRMDSLEIILENSAIKYSNEEKNKFANEKNEIYRSYLTQMDSNDVSNSVRKTLEELRKMKVKIAIGSGSKNTKLILEKTSLNCFEAICDGNDIINGKPDPEVFLKAAKMLNVDPKNAIVVEDSNAGIIAGNKGGFITVAIGDATKSNNAKYNINDLLEIVDIIRKI